MSFLSKLLGEKKPVQESVYSQYKKIQAEIAAANMAASQAGPVEWTIPGNSWGPTMPNEPNQFNYPGSWREYFEDIFRTGFPGYRVTRRSNERSVLTTVYTFYLKNAPGRNDYPEDEPVLFVEVMASRCDVYRLRQDCEKAGIPYRRFYYDHRGWWNTRSYVVERINQALATGR